MSVRVEPPRVDIEPISDEPAEGQRAPRLPEPSRDRQSKRALRSKVSQVRLRILPPVETEVKSSTRRRRRIGLSMLTLGLCLVVFLGYLFVLTDLQEARTQRQLLNVLVTPAGKVPLSGAVPKPGDPAAILKIPAIHLSQVVVQGTTSSDLTKGPGIMPDTARPGTKGNAVIAGRRRTGGAVFENLNKLQPGDSIQLDSGLGSYRYRVESVGLATPGERSPAAPNPKSQLTLITSQSLAGTGLLYVTSHLVTPAATAPRPKHPPSVAELGLSGDPAAWLPTILWGFVLALCLAVSFLAYGRAKERIWTVYLLTTPIILAVALEWYSFIYRLLPATM